jgi:hypothetical protein
MQQHEHWIDHAVRVHTCADKFVGYGCLGLFVVCLLLGLLF